MTNQLLRMLVKKWYNVSISREVATIIAVELEAEYPIDEYDIIPECGLYQVINDVLDHLEVWG